MVYKYRIHGPQFIEYADTIKDVISIIKQSFYGEHLFTVGKFSGYFDVFGNPIYGGDDVLYIDIRDKVSYVGMLDEEGQNIYLTNGKIKEFVLDEGNSERCFVAITYGDHIYHYKDGGLGNGRIKS